jgi:hypothetical protein
VTLGDGRPPWATFLYRNSVGPTATEGVVEGKLSEAKDKLRNPASLAVIGAKHAAGALLGPFANGISVVEELKKDSSAPARALSASFLGADPDRHHSSIWCSLWATRIGWCVRQPRMLLATCRIGRHSLTWNLCSKTTSHCSSSVHWP